MMMGIYRSLKADFKSRKFRLWIVQFSFLYNCFVSIIFLCLDMMFEAFGMSGRRISWMLKTISATFGQAALAVLSVLTDHFFIQMMSNYSLTLFSLLKAILLFLVLYPSYVCCTCE